MSSFSVGDVVVFCAGFSAGGFLVHQHMFEAAASDRAFVAKLVQKVRRLRDDLRFVQDTDEWRGSMTVDATIDGNSYDLRITRREDRHKFHKVSA